MLESHNYISLRKINISQCIALSVAMLFSISNIYADLDLSIAKSNYENGDALTCYTDLKAVEDSHAGELAFDKLLGYCASAVKDHALAVLALERVATVSPSDAEAMMVLAANYDAAGYKDTAVSLYKRLYANNPPETAKRIIEDRLFSVQKESALPPPVTGFDFMLSTGYDTNANAATDINQFIGFDLLENSQETSSAIRNLHLGGYLRRPINKDSQYRLGVNVAAKDYPDARFVNTVFGNLLGAYDKFNENNRWSVSVNLFGLDLENDLNVKGVQGRFDWFRPLQKKRELNLYAQAGANRFPTLDIRDVNVYKLGVGLSQKFGANNQHEARVSLGAGVEDPKSSNEVYAKNIIDFSATLDYRVKDNNLLRFDYNFLESDYDNVFLPFAFSKPRLDDRYSFFAEYHHEINEKWWFVPRAGYINNDSNLEIYNYNRVFAELGISYRPRWQ